MLFFLILGIFSCKKEPEQNDTIILSAIDKSYFVDSTKLTFNIYSDSIYVFNVAVRGEDYDRDENFRGKVKINNDTLDFFPLSFDYARADTAVLKNGWVEFINNKQPFRIKIKNTKLKINKTIDLSKFKYYSVFTYERNSEENENYDVTEKDLKQIENLLKIEFNKKPELEKYDTYLKQVIGYEKKSGEKFATVKCFCDNEDRRKVYEIYN